MDRGFLSLSGAEEKKEEPDPMSSVLRPDNRKQQQNRLRCRRDNNRDYTTGAYHRLPSANVHKLTTVVHSLLLESTATIVSVMKRSYIARHIGIFYDADVMAVEQAQACHWCVALSCSALLCVVSC